MKSVLMVTFTPLTPVAQGNARRVMQMANVYREAGYAVDLLYHDVEAPWNVTKAEEVLSAFRNVWLVPHVERGSVTQVGHPDDWYPEEIEPIVSDLVVQHGYTALHVNYVWYSKLFQKHPTLLKVLDTHDSFADRHARFTDVGLTPEWYSTTRSAEVECLNRADIAIAIQQHDLLGWQFAGCHSAMVLPYNDTSLVPVHRSQPGPNFLTVGYCAADNDFNRAGLMDFLQYESGFQFKLKVWGSICRSFNIFNSAEYPNVIFHGYSDMSMQDLHAQVDVMVNPMYGGTGLKIKNVECLLTNTPIVSTTDAVNGLESVWYFPMFARLPDLVGFLNELGRTREMHSQLVMQARLSGDDYRVLYTHCLTAFKEKL